MAKVTEKFLNQFFFDNYKCLCVPIEGEDILSELQWGQSAFYKGFLDFFKLLQTFLRKDFGDNEKFETRIENVRVQRIPRGQEETRNTGYRTRQRVYILIFAKE